MNNKNKGDLYEIQIKNYIINELNKPAYLWHQTPETILIENGIVGSHNQHRLNRKLIKENKLQDTGIDIIQVDEDNSCSLIQCKNGYKNGLTYSDLTGFALWLLSLDKLNGYVYYTNKLSENIKCLSPNKRINYIKQKFIEKEEIKENKNIIKPFDYQLHAVNEFKNKFINRGILSMPCGTGKTFTSYLISKDYNQIIILSPLKQFAKQNLDRYIEYGYNGVSLLVDSDGERDVKSIKKFIKSNEKFLISSTFDSIDVLPFNKMNNVLIIIDEFHNLSKNNVTDENDYFYKLLMSDHKILFMSATPRVYEMEDDDYNNEIFGEVIYNMTFTEAIENKYITDYKIWLPCIHEDNSKLDNELSIYEIDSVIKAKCKYFYSCLLNNGSRKCIIYCIDTNEINLMIETMNKLNDFYCLCLDINQITSVCSKEKRETILNNFANNDNIQLLFSVRILDECIDIPSCDSIYITYPSQSKIRTIQRLSRCIRIDKNNKFKIGNIYIWCNEYDEILNVLSGIKEYDLFFKNKIKINCIDNYGEADDILFKNDKELVNNYLVGIKEFKQMGWEDKLKMVEEYIIEHEERPSHHNKNNEIKALGSWLSHQITNYKNNEQIMKNENIRTVYMEFIKKYKEYFMSNRELWLANLKNIEEYIIKNNNLPSQYNKHNKIKILHSWLATQQSNYKNNEYIMKNENIRKVYMEFIKKHKEYFMSNNESWLDKLKSIEEYIVKNNKLPSSSDNIPEIKYLGKWIGTQKINYKNNKNIMKNENIKKIWKEFIVKHKDYFLSNLESWLDKLKNIEEYIIKNNKLPSQYDINIETKSLCSWLSNQKQNYKNNKDIMKNNNNRKSWKTFTEKYKEYFD
jgi:superfamily II DNA or RNA helicase